MGSSGNVFERLLAREGTNLYSSIIERMWHLLLKNWDLMLKEIQEDRKLKRDENRKIRRYPCHASKVEVDC